MPSPSAHSASKKQDPALANQESLTELRTHFSQYMAHMVDLMFQGQRENIRFMNQIQASLLKSGKTLTDALSQHNPGNGYTASQAAAPNSLMQSMMDMNALMLDFAQSTAEQSANLAKVTLGNPSGNSHSSQPLGKP